MRILLDTNILMDYLTERDPFYPAAYQIILGCKNKRYDGVVAAHSIVDMFFILRKHFTASERRKLLLAFLGILRVVSIDEEKLRSALQNETFHDFEDCKQSARRKRRPISSSHEIRKTMYIAKCRYYPRSNS